MYNFNESKLLHTKLDKFNTNTVKLCLSKLKGAGQFWIKE